MKANSERVMGKNLRVLGEKPLFYHIGDTLFRAGIFSNLIINTDSKEIGDMACKRYKDWVIIHDRPSKLCGDFVSMNKIIEHDLVICDGEYYFQTHSTNPLLKKDTIIKAVESYFANINQHDSLYSVNKIQSRLFDAEYSPLNHRSGELIRTQDMNPVYEENSNLYVFSKTSFLANDSNRIGTKPLYFQTNKIESVDIDDEDDFIIAEAIFEKLRLNEFKKQT